MTIFLRVTGHKQMLGGLQTEIMPRISGFSDQPVRAAADLWDAFIRAVSRRHLLYDHPSFIAPGAHNFCLLMPLTFLLTRDA